MIDITVKFKSEDEMLEAREKYHEALVGSPAYINNEIAIVEGDDETAFHLVVGLSNGHDLEILEEV